MKKEALFLTVLLALCISTTSAFPAEKPFEGVTLNVMVIAQPYAHAFDLVIDQISEELGVKLSYDMTPPQDSYSKLMLEFSTQSSSYDIVLFQPAWIADYAPHLEPLKPLIEKYGLDFKLDDVIPNYLDLYVSWEDVLCAVPFDGDQFNLFYNKIAFEDERNKNLFKEEFGYDLKPPETWDQYLEIAKFFNGKDWDFDGKPEYGVTEAWQRGGYAYWWWWVKFVSLGGILFDEDMNPLIDSPSGKRALEINVELAKYVPPGTLNFGYPECENAFIKGDAPMVIQWSSTGKSAMDPTNSTIVNNVGVMLTPGVKVGEEIVHRTVLPTGWSAGIPKYAPNKEAAIRVLEILCRPENALKISLDPATVCDPWRISSFESS